MYCWICIYIFRVYGFEANAKRADFKIRIGRCDLRDWPRVWRKNVFIGFRVRCFASLYMAE